MSDRVFWMIGGSIRVEVDDVIVTSSAQRARIVGQHTDGRPVVVMETGPVVGSTFAIFPDAIVGKVA